MQASAFFATWSSSLRCQKVIKTNRKKRREQRKHNQGFPRFLRFLYLLLFKSVPATKEFVMYDMKNLTRLKTIGELAPEAMKTFWAFDKAATAAGAIPAKYKELMAVAVALTTQCPYCIDIHAKKARESGASDAEL